MTTEAATVRDRIKSLRRVRAGDLIPHPKNWRRHPAGQAAAMRAALSEIGYAGALLARDLPEVCGNQAHRLYFGKPNRLMTRDDFDAEYESESEYLGRLGVLTDRERTSLDGTI